MSCLYLKRRRKFSFASCRLPWPLSYQLMMPSAEMACRPWKWCEPACSPLLSLLSLHCPTFAASPGWAGKVCLWCIWRRPVPQKGFLLVVGSIPVSGYVWVKPKHPNQHWTLYHARQLWLNVSLPRCPYYFHDYLPNSRFVLVATSCFPTNDESTVRSIDVSWSVKRDQVSVEKRSCCCAAIFCVIEQHGSTLAYCSKRSLQLPINSERSLFSTSCDAMTSCARLDGFEQEQAVVWHNFGTAFVRTGFICILWRTWSSKKTQNRMYRRLED